MKKNIGSKLETLKCEVISFLGKRLNLTSEEKYHLILNEDVIALYLSKIDGGRGRVNTVDLCGLLIVLRYRRSVIDDFANAMSRSADTRKAWFHDAAARQIIFSCDTPSSFGQIREKNSWHKMFDFFSRLIPMSREDEFNLFYFCLSYQDSVLSITKLRETLSKSKWDCENEVYGNQKLSVRLGKALEVLYDNECSGSEEGLTYELPVSDGRGVMTSEGSVYIAHESRVLQMPTLIERVSLAYESTGGEIDLPLLCRYLPSDQRNRMKSERLYDVKLYLAAQILMDTASVSPDHFRCPESEFVLGENLATFDECHLAKNLEHDSKLLVDMLETDCFNMV